MPSYTLGRMLTVSFVVMILGVCATHIGIAETAALVWLLAIPWLLRIQLKPRSRSAPVGGEFLIFLAVAFLIVSIGLLGLGTLAFVLTGDVTSIWLILAALSMPMGLVAFWTGWTLSVPVGQKATHNPD